MDQRTEFVLRVLRNAERFGEVCKEFGISRKTGYKWKERFFCDGLGGMVDHSRRPKSSPNEVSEAMVCRILKLKLAHRTWGPRKLQSVLERTVAKEEVPSEASFKRILAKAGLVERRRRMPAHEGSRLQAPVRAERCNQVWTIDFKGWWRTRDHRRFEPLTIRDDFSRYILCAQSLESVRTEVVQRQMSRIFERHGLPEVIRSDNGSPFAARRSPLGLSRLSAWWLSLGIHLDRIAPGRPDQNGGHERMHRDMAKEIERHATLDAPTQQATLDVWRRTFNEERPHEALGMRVPQEVYHLSSRRFDPAPVDILYPLGYSVRKVSRTGEIKIQQIPVRISVALRGLQVGLEATQTDQLDVWFCKLCVGRIDLSTRKFHATKDSETDIA